MSFWKRVWERWKRISEIIADFQARVILSLFYFIVVLPFGLLFRALADPLAIRRRGGTSWRDFADRAGTVDKARKQF